MLIYKLLGDQAEQAFARSACPRYGYLAAAHRFLRTRYSLRFPQVGASASACTQAATAVLQHLTRAVCAFHSGLNDASEWKDVRHRTRALPAALRC